MNTFKTDLHRSIEESFDSIDREMKPLNALIEEQRMLTRRISQRRFDLQTLYTQLVCMVMVNYECFGGNKHKVPLIKIHRAAYDSDLKRSKVEVEAIVEASDIPF